MSVSDEGYSSAPNSGNCVEFDISEKFRQRLRETQVQKENLQLKINNGVEQLNLLLTKLPKKSRDTAASLDAKIQSLEHERTRCSLKLSEEKAILRQIKGIERAKTLLAEFQQQELVVKEKKVELGALRDTLRTTIAQIAELKTAISKVELAKRLGCSTADLRTHVADCPAEKLGLLIGKNGANIKAIEKKTGVQMDVDKVGKKIHIIGNQEAILAALELVEDVTLAINESIPLPPDLITYIHAKRAKILEMLVQKHPDVHFDFSREEKVMLVRGRPINVAMAKSEVLNINVKKETLDIKLNQVGTILGKNGSTINKLVKTHDVAIELENQPGAEVRFLEIVGKDDNVVQALAEVKELLYQNEELEVIIVTNQMIRNKLKANSALLIKKIQSDIQAEVGATANVNIIYEKVAKEDRMTAASANLFVRAARHSISKVEELTQNYVDKYQNTIIEFTISTDIIPYVIGKGGKVVNQMRKDHSGSDIEIDRTTGQIQIMADDEETRNNVKQEIEKIVLQNQVTLVKVHKNMLSAILGNSGKEMRDKIMKELNVNFSLSSSEEHIILRGTTEKIKEASEILEDFIASNYTSEFSISIEDKHFLTQDGSDMERIGKENDTKISILKGRRIVIICGKKENVDKSDVQLKRIVFGSNEDDYIVFKLRIPSVALGVIIGKGGSNLSKLEQSHGNVSIYLHKDSSLLCLRGSKDDIEKCRKEIVNTVFTTSVNETILITNEDYESFSHDRTLKKMLDGIPVQMTLNESSIRLRGLSLDIKDARALVNEHMTGQYESSLEFEPLQMEAIQTIIKKDNSHFDKIRDRSKAEIKANYSSCSIIMSGKRSCVKRAKSFLLGFLDTILPSQFSKFKVAKPLLNLIGDSSVLGKISSDTGATLSIDRDLNCIFVQSSNPESVKESFDLLEARKNECSKLNTVIQFEQSDSWLFPKLIENGGAMIEQVQKDWSCSIKIYKDELMIIISGKVEANVSKAASLVGGMIEKERKECIFIDLVESSMSSFIGKGGSNIKKLEEDYGVRIERMRKDPFRLQIEGNESNVELVQFAIVSWMDDWTKKNAGLSCQLEESVVPLILGRDATFLTNMQKEFGVKTDFDRKNLRLTVRGNSAVVRTNAMKQIENYINEAKTGNMTLEEDTGLSEPLNAPQFKNEITHQNGQVNKHEKSPIETSILEEALFNTESNQVPAVLNVNHYAPGPTNTKSVKTSPLPVSSTSGGCSNNAKKLYSLLENTSLSNGSHKENKLPDKPSSVPVSLSVEKIPTDTFIEQYGNSTFPSKTPPPGSFSGAAQKLFSLLASSSNGEKIQSEQWDSSTVSSGIASSSMEDDSFGEHSSTTFKSMSGYTVRL